MTVEFMAFRVMISSPSEISADVEIGRWGDKLEDLHLDEDVEAFVQAKLVQAGGFEGWDVSAMGDL